MAMIAAIDPFATVELGATRKADASLGLGRCPGGSLRWYVSSTNNLVKLGRAPQPPEANEGFSLGPCLAACVGAWALYRQVSGKNLHPIQVSSWNLSDGEMAAAGPQVLEPIDVGRCLLVGAGGVGSCLAYWLSQPGLAGNWAVVDGDHAELHNTNRCMGILVKDTDWNGNTPTNKADLAAAILGAKPKSCWYSELMPDELRADLVLPLANEGGVRTAVSQRGDTILLHATTSRLFEAQLHRHIATRDDCILCRMPRRDLAPSMRCATVPIRTGETSTDAALPFLSATAAVMLASALYRLATGEIENEKPNWFRFLFHDGARIAQSGHCRCSTGCPGGLFPQARAVAYGAGKWAHIGNQPTQTSSCK